MDRNRSSFSSPFFTPLDYSVYRDGDATAFTVEGSTFIGAHCFATGPRNIPLGIYNTYYTTASNLKGVHGGYSVALGYGTNTQTAPRVQLSVPGLRKATSYPDLTAEAQFSLRNVVIGAIRRFTDIIPVGVETSDINSVVIRTAVYMQAFMSCTDEQFIDANDPYSTNNLVTIELPGSGDSDDTKEAKERKIATAERTYDRKLAARHRYQQDNPFRGHKFAGKLVAGEAVERQSLRSIHIAAIDPNLLHIDLQDPAVYGALKNECLVFDASMGMFILLGVAGQSRVPYYVAVDMTQDAFEAAIRPFRLPGSGVVTIIAGLRGCDLTYNNVEWVGDAMSLDSDVVVTLGMTTTPLADEIVPLSLVDVDNGPVAYASFATAFITLGRSGSGKSGALASFAACALAAGSDVHIIRMGEPAIKDDNAAAFETFARSPHSMNIAKYLIRPDGTPLSDGPAKPASPPAQAQAANDASGQSNASTGPTAAPDEDEGDEPEVEDESDDVSVMSVDVNRSEAWAVTDWGNVHYAFNGEMLPYTPLALARALAYIMENVKAGDTVVFDGISALVMYPGALIPGGLSRFVVMFSALLQEISTRLAAHILGSLNLQTQSEDTFREIQEAVRSRLVGDIESVSANAAGALLDIGMRPYLRGDGSRIQVRLPWIHVTETSTVIESEARARRAARAATRQTAASKKQEDVVVEAIPDSRDRFGTNASALAGTMIVTDAEGRSSLKSVAVVEPVVVPDFKPRTRRI